MSETKIHKIDESLDQIETIVNIFEQKMDSLPEEYFENQPEINTEGEAASALPMTETLA